MSFDNASVTKLVNCVRERADRRNTDGRTDEQIDAIIVRACYNTLTPAAVANILQSGGYI